MTTEIKPSSPTRRYRYPRRPERKTIMTTPIKPGIFVSFEGTDCSGKSSMASRFNIYLNEIGTPAILTRDPGGTPIAEALRQIVKHPHETEPLHPTAEIMIFSAARTQLAQQVILPALEAGKIVVCDRYIHSTIAYQQYGRGVPEDLVTPLIEYGSLHRRPDIVFYLQIDPATRTQRLAQRTDQTVTQVDRFESENAQWQEILMKSYDMLATTDKTIITIDARGPENEVFEAICLKWKDYLDDNEIDTDYKNSWLFSSTGDK